MVVKATLRVRHRGCVTERLHGDTFLTQISGERGWDVFVLRAPSPEGLREGLAIAESNGERAEILSETSECVVFRGRNPPGGIVEAVRASPCWIVWPIVYRDGLEHFTLGAPTRESLRALVGRIGRLGDVVVERVSEGPPEDLDESVALGDLVSGLTARQLDALLAGIRGGYYRSPRAVGSDGLAEAFGVSPSTMREHLRKAEEGVLRRLAELVAQRPHVARRATRAPGRPRGLGKR